MKVMKIMKMKEHQKKVVEIGAVVVVASLVHHVSEKGLQMMLLKTIK